MRYCLMVLACASLTSSLTMSMEREHIPGMSPVIVAEVETPQGKCWITLADFLRGDIVDPQTVANPEPYAKKMLKLLLQYFKDFKQDTLISLYVKLMPYIDKAALVKELIARKTDLELDKRLLEEGFYNMRYTFRQEELNHYEARENAHEGKIVRVPASDTIEGYMFFSYKSEKLFGTGSGSDRLQDALRSTNENIEKAQQVLSLLMLNFLAETAL